MLLAQAWPRAVTPATRSAPVFTSLWHLAYAGSCFQVTLSESGLVGSGGSPLLSIAACWAASDWALAGGVSPAPPPQATSEAIGSRDSEAMERRPGMVRMARARLRRTAAFVARVFVAVFL